MIDRYDGLKNYLDFLSVKYNLSICINDFTGFLSVDKNLLKKLLPYIIHSNSFCMHVKSNDDLYKKCISMKKPILDECKKQNDVFYGMCYCGIEEYIIPIISNGFVIGIICVGEFRKNMKKALCRINKIAEKYEYDAPFMQELYVKSTTNQIPDINLIKDLFGIVVVYFLEVYSTLSQTNSSHQQEGIKNDTNDSDILKKIIKYIDENYKSDIKVKDLSIYCYCSESYINHIFKKRMKVNLKAYINKVRFEHAKSLLESTDLSVKNIAFQVGYKDSNYFSKVFSKILGISPLEYRERYKQ